MNGISVLTNIRGQIVADDAAGAAGRGRSQPQRSRRCRSRGTPPLGALEKSALTTSEAQRIAEAIAGEVRWEGAQGYCRCPGIDRHTTANHSTDCKVVCEPVPLAGGTLAPGIYCFHGSCGGVVAGASYELRSQLGKARAARAEEVGEASSLFAVGRAARMPLLLPPAAWVRRGTVRPRQMFLFTPKAPAPAFDPARLERTARKLPQGDAEWLARRSRKQVDNRTPASFLHELYLPGERVVIFDVFRSQGQALWMHLAPPYDARELDGFRTGKPQGVWFLANPVSGEYLPNDQGKLSRRSWQSVTAWRYLVLESDVAEPAHWLAALAQMPLRVAAIYTSGGKSIHALVRLDAESKAHWDEIVATMEAALIILGADPKAMSAVRLTRLPGCERVEKGRMQELLYLNGQPDGTPICEQAL